MGNASNSEYSAAEIRAIANSLLIDPNPESNTNTTVRESLLSDIEYTLAGKERQKREKVFASITAVEGLCCNMIIERKRAVLILEQALYLLPRSNAPMTPQDRIINALVKIAQQSSTGVEAHRQKVDYWERVLKSVTGNEAFLALVRIARGIVPEVSLFAVLNKENPLHDIVMKAENGIVLQRTAYAALNKHFCCNDRATLLFRARGAMPTIYGVHGNGPWGTRKRICGTMGGNS